jgi:2,3-bisphosphoglycerate-dependent phosphoglycerate mutase
MPGDVPGRLPRLVVLRHGQSIWNAEKRFTGRADVDLDLTGVRQAMRCAETLSQCGVLPDTAHASPLTRAYRTAEILLAAMGLREVAVTRSSELSERHYGALQGMTQREAVFRFGADQVARWRRSLDGRPPQQAGSCGVGARSESFADVRERVHRYWQDAICPQLACSRTVLVVGHGTSVRALLCELEGLPEREAASVEVPTGVVRAFEWPSRNVSATAMPVPLPW